MIARRYRVRPAKLARANGLRLTSVLTPGQRLRIPGRVTAARKRRAAPRTVVKAVVHTVQPGEGFIVIARRYKVRATRLARVNGLEPTSVLTPGQRLRVPGRSVAARKAPAAPKAPAATSAARHSVAPGESFFSIAQRYHVSPWRLARANRLSLMTTIVPGQRLTLPEGAHLSSTSFVTAPRCVPRSTGGQACTASIPSWHGRSPGWSQASSRTSSRARERSA